MQAGVDVSSDDGAVGIRTSLNQVIKDFLLLFLLWEVATIEREAFELHYGDAVAMLV